MMQFITDCTLDEEDNWLTFLNQSSLSYDRIGIKPNGRIEYMLEGLKADFVYFYTHILKAA
jgi:hypothetical protein